MPTLEHGAKQRHSSKGSTGNTSAQGSSHLESTGVQGSSHHESIAAQGIESPRFHSRNMYDHKPSKFIYGFPSGNISLVYREPTGTSGKESWEGVTYRGILALKSRFSLCHSSQHRRSQPVVTKILWSEKLCGSEKGKGGRVKKNMCAALSPIENWCR